MTTSKHEDEMKLEQERKNYLGSAGTRFIQVLGDVVIVRNDMPTIRIPTSDVLNFAMKIGLSIPSVSDAENAEQRGK